MTGDLEENPKDRVARFKWRTLMAVPVEVLWEIGAGMLEGAIKYGRYNWRKSKIVDSIYYDATLGHIMCHQAGEDIDPDSGVPHLTKAICSLIVWRDAYIVGNVHDDRPPHADLDRIRAELGAAMERIEEIAAMQGTAAPITAKQQDR